MGYYDKGNKSGKGIQLYQDGKVQAQGLWVANDKIGISKQIDSFAENELVGEGATPTIVNEDAREMTQDERE